MGVLATLYTECFNRLWGFGDALYRVFSKVIGLLATLYIECFLRLWWFWRSFI